MKIKKCRICGKEKDRSEFYKAVSNTDGKKTECKECTNEIHRKRYALDEQFREAAKKRSKEFQEEKNEHCRRLKRERYQAQRDLIIAKQREYAKNNRESIRASDRKWSQENA